MGVGYFTALSKRGARGRVGLLTRQGRCNSGGPYPHVAIRLPNPGNGGQLKEVTIYLHQLAVIADGRGHLLKLTSPPSKEGDHDPSRPRQHNVSQMP